MHGAHIYPQTNYTACAPSALVWHPDDIVETDAAGITYNLNLRSAVKLQRHLRKIRECIYLVVSEVGGGVAAVRCLPTLASPETSTETVGDVYYHQFKKDITVTYHLDDRSQRHFITSSTITLNNNDIMFEEYDTNKWSVNINADGDGELDER